jgi:hypothetical protein
MNDSKLILIMGTGCCGISSPTRLLNEQSETQVSYEEPPLPWNSEDRTRLPLERLHAWTLGWAEARK